MKKKITLLLLFISSFTFSQTNFKFYKSIEDYKSDNFIPGFDIVPYSWRDSDLSEEALDVKINNGPNEKLKASDYPGDIYIPKEGQVWRRFKKKSYIILVYGEFCYYVSAMSSIKPEYYSETISGPVKKFKSSILEKKLKERGLLKSFKKDKPKREFSDNVDEYFTKEVKRNVKYIKLLNETV